MEHPRLTIMRSERQVFRNFSPLASTFAMMSSAKAATNRSRGNPGGGAPAEIPEGLTLCVDAHPHDVVLDHPSQYAVP